MENKKFKSTTFTPEQQLWIAEQEAIMRQESLNLALNDLDNSIQELTEAVNKLGRSDYGVSIADALVNLPHFLGDYLKKK
jgi:hypothetical protein